MLPGSVVRAAGRRAAGAAALLRRRRGAGADRVAGRPVRLPRVRVDVRRRARRRQCGTAGRTGGSTAPVTCTCSSRPDETAAAVAGLVALVGRLAPRKVRQPLARSQQQRPRTASGPMVMSRPGMKPSWATVLPRAYDAHQVGHGLLVGDLGGDRQTACSSALSEAEPSAVTSAPRSRSVQEAIWCRRTVATNARARASEGSVPDGLGDSERPRAAGRRGSGRSG